MEHITGVALKDAQTSLSLIEQAIKDRIGHTFSSYEECNNFATKHNLDLMAYSPQSKSFFHVTHKGELLIEREWVNMYKSILSYSYEERKVMWKPDDYLSRNNALIIGEKGNGVREPLYERDYFLPIGYRNPTTGCFNIANPFKYFAVDHGVDVSYIFELLQHIAGENYLYLLAWLRQKMLYPKEKTEVVPIFTGMQGTGKSSFGEAICIAMFGEENVIVTHSFDATSRFNSDQTDRLVISIEEKTQNDNRNATSILKSLATARTIRKENKGIDPYYQDSHTEYVLTTNELVPVKFDSLNQRRFMVMQTDPDFRRVKKGERETETSNLADEVFTKIYGTTRDSQKVGEPLWNNKTDVEQFKFDLLQNQKLPNPKDFVETDAFKRCFSIPRSIEMIEIEAIIKGLAPFVAKSLENQGIVRILGDYELSDITQFEEGIAYVRRHKDAPPKICINRMLVFQDNKGNSYSHASIDKVAHDLSDWLEEEFGLRVLLDSTAPRGTSFKVSARYRYSPVLTLCLIADTRDKIIPRILTLKKQADPEAFVYRKRYNETYQPAETGCFEVVNPLDATGVRSTEHVTTQRFFLLESDETTPDIVEKEKAKLRYGITAEELYSERIAVQRSEAIRLINSGVAQRAVYSGMKSIHILVEMKNEPQNKEERRWLDAHLKSTLSNRLLFDFSTSDPARLTRAPVTYERIKMIGDVEVHGTQCLIKESPRNVYDLNWRPLYNQWLNNKRAYYEEGAERKMLPTKAIYKNAAVAILDGTFWTSDEWNGQRNSVFFSAYRLVRAMGYAEDLVWDSIADDIKSYYKPDEITYWLSRRTGTLIRSIEEELCQT